MLYKVINCDKVKILIEKDDIIDFGNICFDSDCEQTKNAIAILLLGIYEQTGLNFLSSRIMIETVKGLFDSYYVVITRLDKTEINVVTDTDEVDMYLFKLNNIEEVMDLSKLFVSNKTALKCSKLYRYRNKLYMCLYFSPEDIEKKEFDNLIGDIEKMCTRCRWSILNDVILNEWGSLICENIIENIIAAV